MDSYEMTKIHEDFFSSKSYMESHMKIWDLLLIRTFPNANTTEVIRQFYEGYISFYSNKL